MECGICVEGNETKFSNFESFKTHLTEAHASNAVEVFACHECQKAFSCKKAYRYHCNGHNPAAPESQPPLPELTHSYHGLACSDCGLYLRIPDQESSEEWSALTRIMATHSPAHLVLVQVRSASTLRNEPKINVHIPMNLVVGASMDNQICAHCKKTVLGRAAMRKHLLKGRCIPRMPETALALLVRKDNERDKVNKDRKRTKKILKREGVRWRQKIKSTRKRRARMQKAESERWRNMEVGAVLIPTTIPIFRPATEVLLPYTPNGAVASLHSCSKCKMLIGSFQTSAQHNSCGSKLDRIYAKLDSNNELFKCNKDEKCDHKVCSVLGLQIHRSLAHDEDFTIHSGMEEEKTVTGPLLRSPAHSPNKASTLNESRKRQASTSSAGSENTVPVPPKQRKEKLHTGASGLPEESVPDTATPLQTVRPLMINLLRSCVSNAPSGQSASMQPSPQTSVSNQTPSEVEDEMEAGDVESYTGRNGVAAGSKANGIPGTNAKEASRPRMTLLDCYIKPPTSSYLPKEGFFRLCRLCMTVMPADEETWQTHMKKHRCDFKDRRYSCPDCSLMLTLEELKCHQQEHSLTCIQCTLCKRSFADDVVYFLHLAETHAVDLVHFCKMCSIATKSAEQLREHIHTRACKTTKSNSLEPVPGVIGECLVTFEGGLEPGSEYAPHFAKLFDRKSNRCKVPSCARRSLTLPSETEAMGQQNLNRNALRAQINCRVSCPVDLFPITRCHYICSEHARTRALRRNMTDEQKKDFLKQLKEVREGRNGIGGIHSLASYMRLPRRYHRSGRSISSASSTAAASAAEMSDVADDALTQNGVEPAAAEAAGAPVTSDTAEAATDVEEPSTSTEEVASNNTKKWSVDEIKAKRAECRKRYRAVLLARVAENFCKYGTEFPYTPEQKRSTRLGIEVNYEEINPVRCFFCLSTRGYYPITEENSEEWINFYCTSKGDNMIHGHLNSQFRTTTSEKRVCARHFQLSEIDQDGRLAPTAQPGYCARECITCDEKPNGNEFPIYNKEQLRALADVSIREASFDELLAKCRQEIQYSCSLCVTVACEAHPDMLPADVREELTRAIAAREAEKGKKKKKANGSATVPSSTAPTRCGSEAPPEAAEGPSIAQEFVSAMHYAEKEPPTPMPPPSTSARGDEDNEIGDVREPPTQELRQTLNSALCDAVLEPPTPAAPPPQSISANGDVGSDDDEEHLETVKRVLSKDYVPPTPRAQEHVAEIARDMLVDAPSTSSMAPPRVPPPIQQPSTSTPSASTSAAQQPPQLQHIVKHVPVQQQQQQQQRQSVVQPLPAQNQTPQMILPNPPAPAVAFTPPQQQQQQAARPLRQQPLLPLNPQQQQLLNQFNQRDQKIKQQADQIQATLRTLMPVLPHEKPHYDQLAKRQLAEKAQLQQHCVRNRLDDMQKQLKSMDLSIQHQTELLNLYEQTRQQRLQMAQAQAQQQLMQQQRQQQAQQLAQQQLMQRQQQQAHLQLQQLPQQRPQQVNPMVNTQQPPVSSFQMQHQILMMMQGAAQQAQPAQPQTPPAAQRPAPCQAAPAAVSVQQQQKQQQQRPQQQQAAPPTHGAAPRPDAAQMIAFILDQSKGGMTRDALATYERTLHEMSIKNPRKLAEEYENHWRLLQRHQQPGPSNVQPRPSNAQPGPSNAQPRPSNGHVQQPGPSTSQAAAASTIFGGWEELRIGQKFQCHLCDPKLKDANTPRVRPKDTHSVELLLNALKIVKDSIRWRILWNHWNGKVDSVLICKAHVDVEMDKGLTCNNCRDYCVVEEKVLHNTKHPFYCLECCKEMNCNEHAILQHMFCAHRIKFPSTAEPRLHCPLKGDPRNNCNHISANMREYRNHLRVAHSNVFEVSAPDASNHKCELIFKSEEEMHFHEQCVIEEKNRLGIVTERKLECCPLCGSINLWNGDVGEGAEKVRVGHFTMHMLDWTPVCKHDLQSTRRGKDAKHHFETIHFDKDAPEEPCALCPDADPNLFDIDAHADSHVIIGLSVPKDAEIIERPVDKTKPETRALKLVRSDDTSRALLGLPKI